MYKISIGVFCLVLAVIFGSAMVVSGESDDETMSVPLGIISLGPPEEVEAKRPSVPFPHGTHFVYNCQTCHHKWVYEEPIVGCYTNDCHDVAEAPKPSERGTVDKKLAARYYKKAYHSLCISCHKEIKAQNKKLEMSGRVLENKLPNAGPVGCKGCHVKEEE